tara:strand:- start:73423 stop:74040 length:618 start_codon:yes stop_codon:yes gene_type:complete
MLVNASIAARNESADHSHHHNMFLDEAGMVMNENRNNLPHDCQKILQEYTFEVIAQTSYAADFPGNIFGLSQHEYKVEPCSRITVTFINKDEVRHQWMVHGLPKYLYPAGMFHLEAAGGQQKTGTFIIPSEHKTYLVHCDMAQHMEKGMKAQLVAGDGSGNLWGVPNVSNNFFMDTYLPQNTKLILIVSFVIGTLATVFLILKRE